MKLWPTTRRRVLTAVVGMLVVLTGVGALAVGGSDDDEAAAGEGSEGSVTPKPDGGILDVLAGLPPPDEAGGGEPATGPATSGLEPPSGPPQYRPPERPPPADLSKAEQYADELAGAFASERRVLGCGNAAVGEFVTAQEEEQQPVSMRFVDAPPDIALFVCAVDLGPDGVAAVILAAEEAPHDLSVVLGAATWEEISYLPGLPTPS